MTLKQIIDKEQANRIETGDFGMAACKEYIVKYEQPRRSLYAVLESYVKQANEDPFFNNRMVLACWELINA
jgi:hypothetical protein